MQDFSNFHADKKAWKQGGMKRMTRDYSFTFYYLGSLTFCDIFCTFDEKNGKRIFNTYVEFSGSFGKLP